MNKQSEQFARLRRIAEESLKQVDVNEFPLAISHEIDSLLHELQVYHIELELQNEELLQTQSSLLEARRVFSDLFDYAPIGYLLVNGEGIIERANHTAASLVKRSRQVLVGELFFDLIPPDNRDDYYFFWRKLTRLRTPQTAEIQMRRGANAIFFAQISGVLVNSEGEDDSFRIVITDITTQKAAEKRIQRLRMLDRLTLTANSNDTIIKLALEHLLQMTDAVYASINLFLNHHKEMLVMMFEREGDSTSMTVVQSVSLDIYQYLKKLDVGESHLLIQPTFLPDFLNQMAHFHLFVPIIHSDGLVGFVGLGFSGDGPIAETDIDLAKEIAVQLGIASQQANLFEQIQEHTKNLEKTVEERTAELRLREQSEYEQRVFAQALLSIATTLISTLDLEQVLVQILYSLQSVIPSDASTIVMLQTKDAHRFKSLGLKDMEAAERETLLYEHRHFFSEMLQTRQIHFTTATSKSELWESENPILRFKSYLGAPIIVQDEVIGFINLYKYETDFYSEKYAERLKSFATHTAVGIHNAQLFERGQRLAMLEERQRLARELHDVVSQVLFATSVLAEAFPIMVERQRHEKAIEIAYDIRKLTSSAQAEMRMLLMELHPSGSAYVGLMEQIELLCIGFRGRSLATLDVDIDQVPDIPERVSLTVYRIAQEALNNIIKHSNAQNIELKLKVDEQQLTLTVVDDGIGFDLHHIKAGYGLSIMRERTEAIGGNLQLESGVGEGTSLVLRYPLSGPVSQNNGNRC